MQNRKRTFRSVQIVSLGLIVIFSTGILIEALSDELSSISKTLNQDDTVIIVQPKVDNFFSQQTANSLKSTLDQAPYIRFYNFELVTQGFVSTALKENVETPFIFTNLTKLTQSFTFINEIIPSNDVFVTQSLANNLQMSINDVITISYGDQLLSRRVIGLLDERLPTINSGLYLDYLSIYQPIKSNNSGQSFNRISIELTDETKADLLFSQLNQYNDIKSQFSRAEGRYLNQSAEQLGSTLVVLQIAISFLIIISITNILNLMIKESQFDIRTLLSIGYSEFHVWSLFILISSIIGFLSFVFTMILSQIILTMILSMLSGTTGIQLIILPGIGKNLLAILFNSLIISVFSMMIPSYRGVYRRV